MRNHSISRQLSQSQEDDAVKVTHLDPVEWVHAMSANATFLACEDRDVALNTPMISFARCIDLV